MNKVTITSPEAMAWDQIIEDISMTPLQRLERAFLISDFALEIQRNRKAGGEELSPIKWIELHKVSSGR